MEVEGLSKAFGAVRVLSGVSLRVRTGEVRALLGENGSGKSTLIKILSGYHTRDEGMIRAWGVPLPSGDPTESARLGCRFVHQDLGLVNELSVIDNLALGVGFPTRLGTVREGRARKMAHAELARFGVDIDPRLPVKGLSAAQRTSVAIVRALRPREDGPVRLLVLDEPTAALPTGESEMLFSLIRRVRAEGIGVLYVTHRLDEVFELADTVSVLRNGELVATTPTSELSHGELVQQLVGRDLPDPASRRTVESKAKRADVASEPVIEVRDLRAPGLHGVSFTAEAGQIIGFAGITGSGRENILAAMFGALKREGGTVVVGGKTIPPDRPDAAIAGGLAYLPYDRKALGGFMTLSAVENLTIADLRPFARRLGISGRAERKEAARQFEALDVRPRNGHSRPFQQFSGGNQQKLLFGKWLRCAPVTFLLDEPTQGVDIAAKYALHDRLVEYATAGRTVVIASTDTDELASLCTRVIALRDGRVAGEIAAADITPGAISELVMSGGRAR